MTSNTENPQRFPLPTFLPMYNHQDVLFRHLAPFHEQRLQVDRSSVANDLQKTVKQLQEDQQRYLAEIKYLRNMVLMQQVQLMEAQKQPNNQIIITNSTELFAKATTEKHLSPSSSSSSIITLCLGILSSRSVQCIALGTGLYLIATLHRRAQQNWDMEYYKTKSHMNFAQSLMSMILGPFHQFSRRPRY